MIKKRDKDDNRLIQIKEKSKSDFIKLCATSDETERQYFPPCEDCHKKMDDIRKAYDKAMARPTGEWEEIESSCDIGHRFYHCSVCHRFLDVMTADGETLEDYPFCHCGADMRKQSEV